MHDRDTREQRRVVEEVAGREVVGAVEHDVIAVEDLHHVVGAESHVVGHDVDVGVHGSERLLGRVDLAFADPVHVVQDLALQVGGVDHIHVDDAERADTRGGEIERGG